MSRKLKFSLSALATSLLLVACGGGGSSAVSNAPITVAGAVIDGYIEGAIVCLDINSNGACDAGEPSKTTDADGKYSFTYSGDVSGLHVISIIPETAKDRDDRGLTLQQAGRAAFTLMAPAPSTSSADTHVTPLTTLVSNEMKQTATVNVAETEKKLQDQLGISVKLIGNDYKATSNQTNAKVSELATAISNAIGAAQTVLAGSEAFKNVLATTDTAAINAAARTAAVNLVAKTVVPTIVDKDSGTLSGSVTASTIISTTQSVATSQSAAAAFQASAPVAQSATIEAFVDGVAVGNNSRSGDYIDSNGKRVDGNWSGYINALEVNYIKGDVATRTGTEKSYVLVNNKWYKRYQDGQNYYLTTTGWVIEEPGLPGEPDGDCMSGKSTSNGPNQKICLTKYDYSGKKVSQLINEPCKNSSGTIAGCDPNTVFPSQTYAYGVAISYDVETFKAWVSNDWDGYASGQQVSSLEEFVTKWVQNQNDLTIGNGCNTALRFKEFDSKTKTGTIAFADMGNYSTCNEVWRNIRTANFTETRSFQFRAVNGQTLLTYKMPLVYVKNNPSDSTQYGLFARIDGKIRDGEYWPSGLTYRIEPNGSTKLGNKNLLNTYLKLIGAPDYPY